MSKKSSYDALVIGLGAMGSATLYHLAKAGVRVLGIDQFAPPHPHGSSHGETRITRLAIGEGERYTPFALRSHELWRDLERENNTKLLFPVGGLVIGDSAGKGLFHNKLDFLGTTISAAQKHGIRHDIISSQELRKRFPQFNVTPNESAYFEYEAGYLNPEECIRTQLQGAQKHGATIKTNQRVSGIRQTPLGTIEVITDDGTYSAEQIVVTAGPWIQKLFPDTFPTLRVTRQTLHWFPTGPHHAFFSPERCPVFIWSFSDREDGIYGFPAVDGPLGGIKLASERYESSVDPDHVDRVVSERATTTFFNDYIKDRMPHLSLPCIRHTTCLYTVTPNSDFVIGRLPYLPQCLAISACSGHGFKHSAAVGEAAAQVLAKGSSVLPLDAFPIPFTAPASPPNQLT